MTDLNRKAYQDLIDEDIEYIEKYFPKHSLEKMHIIEILKWSVKEIYDSRNIIPLNRG
jgi:hypothetical protein